MQRLPWNNAAGAGIRRQWQRPIALGILDDHSRLCCHLQWYLSEIAEEVTEGLVRLGIVHEKTLPYSPYQNGKQESFWATLEGRLMEMLDGVAELTLEFLNEATQAWVEIEYNRTTCRETSCSPVERFAQAPDVLRASPSTGALREAFRLETRRRQRESDGTISLEGVRFEIPARYRHFRDVSVRYARWDLSRAETSGGAMDQLNVTTLSAPCCHQSANTPRKTSMGG